MSSSDERAAGQTAGAALSDATPEPQEDRGVSRRHFLGVASTVAVAATTSHGLSAAAQAAEHATDPEARDERQDREHLRDTTKLRKDRAQALWDQGIFAHYSNGDEDRYPNKIGTDTRGLPHDARGEVDLTAWASLKRALDSQSPGDFEQVILGGTRKLQQPLGTLAINVIGAAAPQFVVPPAPALASAERAAEAVEAYWQSLARDVPFHEYRDDTDNEILRAASAELSKLSGYTGPRDENGKVTPAVLFRGSARYRDASDHTGRRAKSVIPPGVLVGPYISQFILRDIPYGVQLIVGALRTQAAGQTNDFLTNYDEWLANQDGKDVKRTITFDSTRRYLSTGRDLAEYAHGGAPGFWGASILLGTSVAAGGFAAPFNATNPYAKLRKSASGSATFGLSAIQGYLPLSSSREIRANYWQKWFVHRTLRPEAFGGLVHNVLESGVDHPLHDDVLSSEAVDRSFRKHGTYLLSSAYPEGAPNHGSYPGGASSSAAVNATILKAFFDESYVLPNPVQPDPRDPTKLIPYQGPPLTLGGELNKLAANIGQGRNWAGIHWRSDAAASLPQAEEVAFAILRDEQPTFHEPFEGFKLSRFDGSLVTL